MKFTLDANIYDKDVILFVLNNYDINFQIEFNNEGWEITIEDISSEILDKIKKEINEQQLRKDIASQNKKIREAIITAALSLPNE